MISFTADLYLLLPLGCSPTVRYFGYLWTSLDFSHTLSGECFDIDNSFSRERCRFVNRWISSRKDDSPGLLNQGAGV